MNNALAHLGRWVDEERGCNGFGGSTDSYPRKHWTTTTAADCFRDVMDADLGRCVGG
jgi:hypothetical protein